MTMVGHYLKIREGESFSDYFDRRFTFTCAVGILGGTFLFVIVQALTASGIIAENGL